MAIQSNLYAAAARQSHQLWAARFCWRRNHGASILAKGADIRHFDWRVPIWIVRRNADLVEE